VDDSAKKGSKDDKKGKKVGRKAGKETEAEDDGEESPPKSRRRGAISSLDPLYSIYPFVQIQMSVECCVLSSVSVPRPTG